MGTMAPRNAAAPSASPSFNVPFLTHGKTASLAAFKGQPIMLWQVATWCKSCAVGLQALARHEALIDGSRVKVVVLRDYKDAGYPGETMHKFTLAQAPTLLHDSHFVIGKDTKALFDVYNPHHYVDVYYLIKPDGHVAAVSSNPAITFNKIKRFVAADGHA
ncbi:MAG TPA: redoxin domain-containing protein [Nevskiaceae bacterium]|nr:redoxin domain-containing protein [Nevskiaceae bacterium]